MSGSVKNKEGESIIMSGKEGRKQDLRIFVITCAIGALLLTGIMLLYEYGKMFIICLKPEHDFNYVMAKGLTEGMHIKGEVPVLYSCFAHMEHGDTQKVVYYYYGIPAAGGMVILQVPPEKYDMAEKLKEETQDFYKSGVLPEAAIPLEGYAVEAMGRLPYLMDEYLTEIGYPEERKEHKEKVLMICDGSRSLANARIYAPVGMICLTLGSLAIVFILFRKRFRRS